VFIALLLFGGVSVNTGCAIKMFRQLEYDRNCVAYGMSKEFALIMYVKFEFLKSSLSFDFASGMMVTNQILLILLTMYKNQVAKRDGWDKVPVVKVLVRDGVLIFIVSTGWCLSLSPFLLLSECFHRQR
jgi:hypothetical protein